MQLDFDVFDPSDSVIDSLAAPDFALTVKCDEAEIESDRFYIDSRRVSNHVCHVACYDRLSRADEKFTADGAGWWTDGKMAANIALNRICAILGFEGYSLSSRGSILDYIKFSKSDLEGKTCGEILDIISEVIVGVWACSGSSLHLISFGAVDGSNITVSERTELEYQGKTAVIGLVMKNSFTGKTYSRGTTTGNGTVIQVENGFVSEYAADVVWAGVQGYQYTAWNCEKAVMPLETFSFNRSFIFIGQDIPESLGEFLLPRSSNYSVDSTGIYFSGGCSTVDEWNYKSKLEREKIGIGKAVGNLSVSESGRVNYINLN